MMPVALSTPATPLTVSSSPAGTVAAAAPETEPPHRKRRIDPSPRGGGQALIHLLCY